MAELEGWEVSRLVEMPPGQIMANLREFAEAVEKFRRGMVVGQLFNGQRDETFKEGIEAIRDDGFLRDLENFGGSLAMAVRAQRSKNEVRRTGGSYSRGA